MTIRVLKRSLLTCSFVFLTGSIIALAQDNQTILSSFPIVPMTVRFRFVPQYFVQLIDDDPKYSRIEALIDNDPNRPWYEIILADKTTGNKIFYSNSEKTVNTLQRVGKTAFQGVIQFAVSTQTDSTSTYQIELSDFSGQQIIWKFAVSPKTTKVQPGFMSRPDTSGFVLMALDQRGAAMLGTSLIIGNEHHPVTSAQHSKDFQDELAKFGTFYGTGLTVAEIMPGTEFWRVDSWPDVLKAGEKWILHTSGGQKRVLTIDSVSDNQIVIDQIDQAASSHVRLDVRRLNDDFLLSSLSIMSQSHSFHISFMPELPFPTIGLDDTTKVSFVVSEDSQTGIAHGNLLARRRFGDESVNWTFDAPDWARTRLIETGASVLVESVINGAKPVR